MGTVLVLVVLVLAAFAVVTVVRNRQRTAAGASRPALQPMSPVDEQRALHGDVRRLGPGDVVHHEGTDFLVDRTVDFDEDGFRWTEHLLLDSVGGRKLWLSVEDDEGVEVAVWERVAGAALDPDARTVEHQGVTYEREESGRASFVVRDQGGERERGTMQYADFQHGDLLLGFERFGSGDWEVSTGTKVPEHALDVYPAGR